VPARQPLEDSSEARRVVLHRHVVAGGDSSSGGMTPATIGISATSATAIDVKSKSTERAQYGTEGCQQRSGLIGPRSARGAPPVVYRYTEVPERQLRPGRPAPLPSSVSVVDLIGSKQH
jgi:hypothetical protein